MVDLIALRDPGTSTVLSRSKRKEFAMVLHHACMVNDTKVSVLSGIDEMVGSFRNRIVTGDASNLKLPIILPIEVLEAVKE